MFAQVLLSRVRDRDAVAERFQRWGREVGSGASGWSDVTGGITDDGRLIAVARFESEDAARANADREAQDAWWSETSRLLDEPTFYESHDIRQLWDGPTSEAGFVQMMLARVADRRVVEEIEANLDEAFRRWRPDALGGYRVWLPDGRMLAVDYFSSEAEARKGEQSDPPPELAEAFPRWMAQMSDQEWFDLHPSWVSVRVK